MLAASLLFTEPAKAQLAVSVDHRAADSAHGADPHNDRWLARDKAAHFALSCAIIGFGYHLGHVEHGGTRPGTRNAAVAVSLSLGLAKELWDGTKEGNHFSLKDLAADIAGTACGAAVFTRK